MTDRTRGRLYLLTFVAVLAIAALYIQYKTDIVGDILSRQPKPLFPTGESFSLAADEGVSFLSTKDGVLVATKDGAAHYKINGSVAWNITYTMNNPKVVSSGDVFAIFDPGGKKAYVADGKELKYTITTEDNIQNVAVNPKAISAVIFDRKDRYSIQLFNATGGKSLERKIEEEGVYPIAAAISEGGEFYAISCIDTTKTSLFCSIMLFVTDIVESAYAKTAPYAAGEKVDVIAPTLKFLDKDRFLALSDSGLFILDNNGKEVFTYDFVVKPEYVDVSDERFGYIEKGDVSVLDYKGENVYTLANINAISLDFCEEGSIIKTRSEYLFVDKKGHPVWKIMNDANISTVFAINKKKALVVRGGRVEVFSTKVPKTDNNGEKP